MLISVTSFFRNPEAFQALANTVVGGLFENRSSSDPIRVWIAGCATGEEAYTLAMLLREEADRHPEPPAIQIYATDIDERAIAVGRAGSYPEGIANDVTPERLRRFFQKDGDRYRVTKAIRGSVLFAVHDLLRDPPFSRVDLVVCRNLLIYLDQEAQLAVFKTIHAALQPDGHLLLGASESADAAPDLFRPTHKKHRLYEVEAASLQTRGRVSMPVAPSEVRRPEVALPPDRKWSSSIERHRWALEQVAPPSVLIDGRQQILHMSVEASPFFIRAGGIPSHDLVANTQPELRGEMQAATHRAQGTGEPATVQATWTSAHGVRRKVSISVQPFHDDETGSDFSLVTLQESELFDDAPAGDADVSGNQIVRQLQSEIGQLKGHLQDTIDRTIASTEELTASNQELQAMNEELRSASEELETSKEELQSINEELITVNLELKHKVDETIEITDDLQNLIASTDIALVFTDAQMRVKRFTPRATDLFALRPGDVGRSLLDITHRLEWETVTSDAEQALTHLRPIERETRSLDGRHYLARVMPYRTAANRVEGAVMTFVDISSRVAAERRYSESEERLRVAAESVRAYAIITLDESGAIMTWNAGARDAFRYNEKEVIGKPFELLFTPEDRAAGVPQQELAKARETGSAEDERWHLRKHGTRFYCSGVTTTVETNGVLGFAKIARDLTGTKLLETLRDDELSRQRQAGLAAEAAIRLKDEFLAVMSHELKHPLNLIHINAELLTRMPEIDRFPGIRRAADTIQRAVAGQARIIDDLLDLSRARTGKMTMTLIPTSLRDIVVRIVEAARGDAAAKQVRYEWAIDSDDPLMVACDAGRIEQIVWNLLSNAIKFTDAGGSVLVRLERRDREAVLEVTDSGRGIAAAALGDVFTMFHQERRETRNGEGGMGIGLALVKELTEAQGGRVGVRSPGAGQGATFVVAMPLVGHDPALRPGRGEVDEHALRGLRILAVDDSFDALEPFAALLRFEEAEVVEAHSGAEALEILGREPFDLMISDIGMPKMDGYELINAIRQRDDVGGLVAIAMSGYGRLRDVQRASEVGFDAHLTKPASLDDCKRLVTQLRESGRLDPAR